MRAGHSAASTQLSLLAIASGRPTSSSDQEWRFGDDRDSHGRNMQLLSRRSAHIQKMCLAQHMRSRIHRVIRILVERRMNEVGMTPALLHERAHEPYSSQHLFSKLATSAANLRCTTGWAGMARWKLGGIGAFRLACARLRVCARELPQIPCHGHWREISLAFVGSLSRQIPFSKPIIYSQHTKRVNVNVN